MPWQLRLVTDLTTGFEGVRVEHKMQTNILGNVHFHTRKDNVRVPPTTSAVFVPKPLVGIHV